MTAFKRSDKWVAKFQYGGKQRWVPGGPWATKKEATRAEYLYRAKLEARGTSETCASFAERWLKEWPRKAVSSRMNYASCVNRFAEHFGEKQIAEVTRLEARSWALTVPRNVTQVVATMFEDARDVGLVTVNPFHRLRLPPKSTEDVRPPSLDEYRRLLEACDVLEGYAEEFRAMIQFSAWTGVRASELWALRWEDVRVDTVWIRQARKRDGSYTKPKNGEERQIALVGPAADALLKFKELPSRDDGFIFHSPQGKTLREHSHRDSWHKVRAEAGLDHLRWHSLRHFCATQLLEMGMSHFDVAVQLGHRDGGALVMQRYGHPSEDAARERLLKAFEFEVEEVRP
jgi:integrase